MLTAMSIVVMLAVGYAFFREGVFTAFTMLVNVVLAGVIAFNFWEPITGMVDPLVQNNFLEGYQDFLILVPLFCLALGLMRMITNNLANAQIEFSPVVQQFGGAAVGMVTGYLVSGFLICAFETLPWHQNFIDFQPRRIGESDLRRILPADRVWLALMRHAGAYSFAGDADGPNAESPFDRYPTFDRAGTFELRYFRYRRYPDGGNPTNYMGELDRDLVAPPATLTPPPITPPVTAPFAAPKAPQQPTTTPPGAGQTPPGTSPPANGNPKAPPPGTTVPGKS